MLNAGRQGCAPWLAFFLVVVGARLLLIALYGTDTPMRDEWFVLAQRLYSPLLHGSLSMANLLEPFNEHRLVTTRLFCLLLLELDGGVWSPVQQMVGSALVQGLALTSLTALLARACPPASRPVFFILSLVLCGLPLAVENILIGFAVQYYLLILFSTVFMWALVAAEAFSGLWFVGMVCGVLSFLSMASGALTFLCGAAFLALRYMRGGGQRHDVAVFLGLLLAALLCLHLTPPAPADWWGARSVFEFAFALVRILSWPGLAGCALIIYLPLAWFVVGLLRRPPEPRDPAWFVLLVALWVGVHFVAFSYSRAQAPLASRYNDFFVIGLVLNFLCALVREQQKAALRAAQPEAERAPPPYMPLSQLWILVVLAGTIFYCSFLVKELDKKLEWAPLPEQNVRAYLQSHDFAVLAGKPYPDIPYDHPQDLKMMLDDPALARALPPNLAPANGERQPRLLRALTAHLEGGGLACMLAGLIGLALLAPRYAGQRPPAQAAG